MRSLGRQIHSATLAHHGFSAHGHGEIGARAVSNFSDAYIREMRAPMQTDMNLFLEVLAGAFALAVILLRIGLV